MSFVKTVHSIAVLSMAMSKAEIKDPPESRLRSRFYGSMDRLVRTPPGPNRILRPIVFESLEGNGYHPSYEFNVSLSAERLTSSWNLVEIDGEWKIIDTQVSYGTLSIFHHFFIVG